MGADPGTLRDCEQPLTFVTVGGRCPVLPYSDISAEFYRNITMIELLARLLHCLTEPVACPMQLCAVADSRSDAGSADGEGTERRVQPHN